LFHRRLQSLNDPPSPRDTEAVAAGSPLREGSPRHALRRAAQLFALLLCAAVAYLALLGLPRPAVRAIERKLARAGIPVSIGWIGWEPGRGILARNVVVYQEVARRQPFCRISRIGPLMDLPGGLRGRGWIRGVYFSGLEKTFRFVGSSSQREAELPVHSGRGAILFGTEEVWLADFRLDVGGIRVLADGRIRKTAEKKPPVAGRPPTLAELEDRLRTVPDWVVSLVDALREAGRSGSLEARLHFDVPPSGIQEARAILRVQGEQMSCYGAEIGRVSGIASLAEGVLRLSRLELGTGGRRLTATATYDLARNVCSLSLSNSLPLSFLSCILPARWIADARQSGIRFRGDMWTWVEAGPASPARLYTNFAALVSVARTELRNVRVDRLTCALAGRGRSLRIHPLRLQFGDGGQSGWAEFGLLVDTEDGAFQGAFRAELDPHAVLGWVEPGGADFIRLFEFSQRPVATGTFYGVLGNPKAFGLAGTGWMTNCTYRGEAVAKAMAVFSFTNDFLRFSPLVVQRGEGTLRGDIGIDFIGRRMEIDACSTIEPQATARMVGPAMASILDRFRFDGPARVCLTGTVAYGEDPQGTDFRGRVECRQVHYDRWSAHRVAFEVLGRDDRLVFTNLEAELYGGTLQGHLLMKDLRPGSVPAFAGEFHIREVDVDRLRAAVAPGGKEKFSGRLQLDLALSGPMSSNVLQQMTGHGYLKIEDGYLFRVPVLLALSRFLSKIDPRIGYATLADFKAHFRVYEGKVRTDDALLMGEMFSIRARGRYYFDERLDFIVRVQFLRRGPLAKFINTATFALTKLFEFHLGGRLSRPRWRPMNFPKELFLIFD